jgi:translation initiation factor 1
MGKKRKIHIDLQEGKVECALLGDLFKSQGILQAEGEEKKPSSDGVQQEIALKKPDFSKVGRVVLQFEKKGHGGKQATRVEGLPFIAEDLCILARELRKDMGCGAWVDGDSILLQGDLVDRLKAWFSRKGVKQIVISGRGGGAG